MNNELRKGTQFTKFGACSEHNKPYGLMYYTNQRTSDAVNASDNFLSLKYSTDTEETKHKVAYAIGIKSTNKFRNWLGLQLLYFATSIDAKDSLETRAMLQNNQGKRQL
jgi:hypothetical protein